MIQIPKNPFIIVDGSSYLYRAYYAYSSLVDTKGKSTGAIYGMLRMLRSLFFRYHSTHAVIVFDASKKTFRNKIFKQYKSNRPPMPDNLRSQIKPLYDIIKAIGLPMLVVPDVEADDVIGTISQNIEKEGYSVLISTNDKDMAQLVTSKVILVDTITNSVLGTEEVIHKYGVPPDLIVDLIALMGDPSDNIPGVPGIGKKIAQTLLKSIGRLDVLYAESEKIADLGFYGAKTVAIKLKKNREKAYLSYQLAKIKTNLQLKETYNHFLIQKINTKELVQLFQKHKFTSYINNLNTWEQLNILNLRSKII